MAVHMLDFNFGGAEDGTFRNIETTNSGGLYAHKQIEGVSR